jgi:4a-hydroxytetrahydrobiopterin dehydratase
LVGGHDEPKLGEFSYEDADSLVEPGGPARLRLGPGLGEIQIRDATGRRATIWFQPTEAHDVPRQRWHLDLRIPPEVVKDRITAAIEAGGELVDAAAASAFWVLADPQGNRACLTTWQGRESLGA